MERQKDKILIVDDVELNRAILCELFAGDYEILEADNGKTAVDLMEQYHEEIAIVLMDIVMPGLNGFQATRTLTRDEETRHIPVIVCTSKGQETDKIWGLRQGAQDYLVKPINGEELLSKIAAL